MEDEENVAPDFRQATEGLEEGLETCQKIVADYRSALRGLNGLAPAPDTGNDTN